MLKSIARILLISLFFVFTGCGTYKPKGANIRENTISGYVNPYFSDRDSDYIYKANIDVYGRKLGGIVVIKKIDENFHRVVFTTDFGNKLLDFEVSADDFKIHFVVDGFNNKRMLKILETDFRILLQPEYKVNQTFDSEVSAIYQSKQTKNTIYLSENKEDIFLNKIIVTKHSKEKITFEFQNKKDTFAEDIEIIHHSTKYKMKLKKI